MLRTLDIDWNKRRHATWIGLLFFLTMLDYLITYYGVSYLGIVGEANPFMVWLFEVPFIPGLMLRTMMCLTLVHIMNLTYQEDRKAGMRVLMFGIIANIFILTNHMFWFIYFSYLFF